MLERTDVRTASVALVAVGALTAACGPGSPAGTATPGSAAGAHATDDVTPALATAWNGYRQAFIGADGRVTAPAAGDRSTSEGQSYAMLRAAWSGDEATFVRVWHWTRTNLQVRSDGLFAWLWKPGQGIADRNSAADADSDIALALLFGSRRFGNSVYLTEAQRVLTGIWESDVTEVAGMPVLTAGSWAPASAPVAVDPSYFAP